MNAVLKWHENANGQLVKCPAKIKCRLGGEHFPGNTVAEAEAARERYLLQFHSLNAKNINNSTASLNEGNVTPEQNKDDDDDAHKGSYITKDEYEKYMASLPLWEEAQSYNEVAELVKSWLRGEIYTTPYNYGSSDDMSNENDLDDAQKHNDLLLALNTGKMITTNIMDERTSTPVDGMEFKSQLSGVIHESELEEFKKFCEEEGIPISTWHASDPVDSPRVPIDENKVEYSAALRIPNPETGEFTYVGNVTGVPDFLDSNAYGGDFKWSSKLTEEAKSFHGFSVMASEFGNGDKLWKSLDKWTKRKKKTSKAKTPKEKVKPNIEEEVVEAPVKTPTKKDAGRRNSKPEYNAQEDAYRGRSVKIFEGIWRSLSNFFNLFFTRGRS